MSVHQAAVLAILLYLASTINAQRGVRAFIDESARDEKLTGKPCVMRACLLPMMLLGIHSAVPHAGARSCDGRLAVAVLGDRQKELKEAILLHEQKGESADPAITRKLKKQVAK